MNIVHFIRESIAFMLSFFIKPFRGGVLGLFFLFVAPSVLLAGQKEIVPSRPSFGDGSSGNPYQISSAEELYWFADTVQVLIKDNNKLSSLPDLSSKLNAKLTADIVVNTSVLDSDGNLNSNYDDFVKWKPIGFPNSQSDKFFYYSSTFDGNGHSISGLYCDEWASAFMFTVGGNGVINDLTIKDSYFHGFPYAATFASFLSGKLEKCSSFSTIIADEGFVYTENDKNRAIYPVSDSLTSIAGALVAAIVPWSLYGTNAQIISSSSMCRVFAYSVNGSAYSSGLVGSFFSFHKYFDKYEHSNDDKIEIINSFSSSIVSAIGNKSHFAPFLSNWFFSTPGAKTSINLPNFKIYSDCFYDSTKCSAIQDTSYFYRLDKKISVGPDKSQNLEVVLNYEKVGETVYYKLYKDSLSAFPTSSFQSGEICYLLNKQSSDSPKWFQEIGVDSVPVLSPKTNIVYKQPDNSVYCNNDAMPQYTNHIIPNKSHNLKKIPAQEATCSENGNIAYQVCDRCNTYFTDSSEPTIITDKSSVVIPSPGHDYQYTKSWAADSSKCEVSWTCSHNASHLGNKTVSSKSVVITPVTCATAGKSAYVASFSDQEHSFTDTLFFEVKATGHNYKQVDGAAATCEKNGSLEHYECSKCSLLFLKDGNKYSNVAKEDLVVNALGHNYAVAWKWNAEHSKCDASMVCKNDNSHKQEIGSSVATKDSIVATCQHEGLKCYIAKARYGDVLYTDTVFEKLTITSHKRVLIPASAPTCENIGMKEHYKCTMCDSLFLDEKGVPITDNSSLTVPPLMHSYKFKSVNFDTLTYKYSVLYECENDGSHTITDDEHLDISTLDSIPSSCTKRGNVSLLLSSDLYGKWEKTVSYTLPLASHRLKSVAMKDATCTENGMEAHSVCEDCGVLFDANQKETKKEDFVIPTTGHKYELASAEWNKDYDACVFTLACKNDDEKVVVDSKSDTVEFVSPTCENSGYVKYVASIDSFGVSHSETATVEVEQLPHSYRFVSLDFDTLTYKYKVNYVCKHNEKHIISDDANASIVTLDSVPSTCVSNGKVTLSLTSSLYDKVEETIVYSLPLAHHKYQYKDMVSPTCEDAGLDEHYSCAVCDSMFDTYFKPVAKEKITLSALGHSYKFESLDFDSQTYKYKINYVCGHNEKHIVFDDESANIVTLDSVPSTCISSGKVVLSLTSSLYDKVEETIVYSLPLAHHKYQYKDMVSPTCEDAGFDEHYSCAVCDSIFDTDYIPVAKEKITMSALGHSYKFVSLNFDTLTYRYKVNYLCARDASHSVSDSENATIALQDSVPSTCSTRGSVTLQINSELYGDVSETISFLLPLGEHKLDYVGENAPLCDKDGVGEHYVCGVCDSLFDADKMSVSYLDLRLPMLGHKFDEPQWHWADDFSTASVEMECLRKCGYAYRETLDVDSSVVAEPNCMYDGKIEYAAGFEFDGSEYTDDKTVSIPKDTAKHIDADHNDVCDLCGLTLKAALCMPLAQELFEIVGNDIILNRIGEKYYICDATGRCLFLIGGGAITLKQGVYTLSALGRSFTFLIK